MWSAQSWKCGADPATISANCQAFSSPPHELRSVEDPALLQIVQDDLAGVGSVHCGLRRLGYSSKVS